MVDGVGEEVGGKVVVVGGVSEERIGSWVVRGIGGQGPSYGCWAWFEL